MNQICIGDFDLLIGLICGIGLGYILSEIIRNFKFKIVRKDKNEEDSIKQEKEVKGKWK